MGTPLPGPSQAQQQRQEKDCRRRATGKKCLRPNECHFASRGFALNEARVIDPYGEATSFRFAENLAQSFARNARVVNKPALEQCSARQEDEGGVYNILQC